MTYIINLDINANLFVIKRISLDEGGYFRPRFWYVRRKLYRHIKQTMMA